MSQKRIFSDMEENEPVEGNPLELKKQRLDSNEPSDPLPPPTDEPVTDRESLSTPESVSRSEERLRVCPLEEEEAKDDEVETGLNLCTRVHFEAGLVLSVTARNFMFAPHD